MRTIAIAGHLCADVTPAVPASTRLEPGRLFAVGPLRITTGGCVANTGTVLADLGTTVRIHAVVGDDPLGRLVADELAAHPRLVGAPTVAEHAATSYSVVIEQPGVDRTIWHYTGANDRFDPLDVNPAGTDVLHVGYPSLLPRAIADNGAALHELLDKAKCSGVTTSMDLAVVDPESTVGQLDWDRLFDSLLPLTDVISPSLDDLTSALHCADTDQERSAHDLADDLIRRGAAVVAISAGSRGLILKTAGIDRLRRGGRALAGLDDAWADVSMRARPRVAVDAASTNGAGDASTAGLLYAIAAGASPAQACALASACAAVVISGGRPTREAIIAIDPALACVIAGPGVVEPEVLTANQPTGRFYRGGARIADFRGITSAGTHAPEDWVGSTTSVRGQDPVGKTRLGDGPLLTDAIALDPYGWLGAEHVAAFGSDTKLLVKLLDAGERLPVHAHPDRAFASRTLGAAHGKAEAWYILSPGEVRLGLRRDLSRSELRRIIADQDVEVLLDAMHAVTVATGDRVFVPPGLLHAIGEGILLAEVQEPEDLSILIEWRDFSIDGSVDGHLGLGFELALQAVETRARTEEQIGSLVLTADEGRSGNDVSCLPPEADPFFRLERVVVDGTVALEPGFAVLIVVDGSIELAANGPRLSLARGGTALLPAAAAPVILVGNGSVLVARPPLPSVALAG